MKPTTPINWQQPFVNIFKHFTIASDKNVVKHGDITSQMDSQIKSTIYKIMGTSPSSNFINMPKLSGQSLGLSGRYIYFLFKPVPNKYFSIHIDIATQEKIVLRVSFSNLFKEFKSTNTWLQFPYVIQAPKDTVYEKTEQAAKDLSGSAPPMTRWTILCVDLLSLTQIYSNRTYSCVRGFKLCSNMLVKNVITSDLLYEPGVTHTEIRLRNGNSGSSHQGSAAFPRELAYPCEKYENWHQLYDYVSFPAESFKKPFDSVGQSRILVTENTKSDQEPQKYNAKIFGTHPSVSSNAITHSEKHVNLNKMRNSSQTRQIRSGVIPSFPLVGVPDDDNHLTKKSYSLENIFQNEINFVSPDEAEKQNELDIHVYPFKSAHNIAVSPACSLISHSSSSLSSASMSSLASRSKQGFYGQKFETHLEPDPILRLKRIIGFANQQSGVLNLTNCIRWSADGRYLIYSCQTIVVANEIKTGEQWCFVGHADRVSCIALNPTNTIIASGQTGPHSLIRLWDFKSRQCLSIFRNHDHSLNLLEFSSCGNYLCGIGKDKQGKSMMILWDISGYNSSSGTVKLIAKAHTDTHISRVIFVPYDSTRLVTCGRDNVRFWRLKNDSLRSCAVNLSPYIQALNIDELNEKNMDNNAHVPVKDKIFLEFTDLCVNSREDNLAYACTRTGQIFVFNMGRMEIENVRVLEPLIKRTGILMNGKNEISPCLRLNTLTVSDNWCATGSDDGYVRIWPLDFSQVSVEAEHEAPIGVARFSPDSQKIVTATLSGNLGILDVKQREYSTLIRSHTDEIIDADINVNCKYIATCSRDGSVRVWNYETFKQLYDFSAPNESPTRLCFHKSDVFACGFNSGRIRVFDVEKAKLKCEISTGNMPKKGKANQKLPEITDLKYSNDSKRLLSCDSMKYLCLYDSEKEYSLIRMLPNCISVPGSMIISPDQKYLALIGPSDCLISVFESNSLNEMLRIDVSMNEVYDRKSSAKSGSDTALRLAYSAYDQHQLMCSTVSNKLLKFDSRNGRLLSSIPKIHRSNTDYLKVSSDGRFLITSGDNTIKIWDYEMRLEKNFQAFIGHSSSVNCVLLSPDSRTLISVGDSIVFWDFLAYVPEDEERNNKKKASLPEGRDIEEIENHPIMQETLPKKKSSHSNKPSNSSNNINKPNEIPNLLHNNMTDNQSKNRSQKIPPPNEPTEQITHTYSKKNDEWSNVSFERPRTPPKAMDVHIETITANGEIEDTFLNDEMTILESNLSNSSNSIKNQPLHQQRMKKFANLPNFVSSLTTGLYNNVNDTNDSDDTALCKLAGQQISPTGSNSSAGVAHFINGEFTENVLNQQSAFNSNSYVNIFEKTTEKMKKFELNESKPNVAKHLNTRNKDSVCAKRRYTAPEGKCGIKLNSVIGYNGKHAAVNMVWNPEKDLFAYTIGSVVTVEDLKTSKQRILYSSNHQEDISVLCLRNDCLQMASVSSSQHNSTTANKICNILIWDCEKFECVNTLQHRHAWNVTCMSYSKDDRYLISVSDYNSPSLAIWSTFDYSALVSVDSLAYVVNDIAWNPCKLNEFALCGQTKLLNICVIDEESKGRNGLLRFNELETPLVICEQQNEDFDYTSVVYSEDFLLFSGTSKGLITVWNCKTNTCFLNWQADTSEIDVLVSIKNRLITGSSKGNLKLWTVSSIHEMKSATNKASLRLDGLTIDNEISLNSAIKCCQFDSALDIGIVATNKGTVWYVNWQEETSVRLVSTHNAKINSILCINDKYLSTASDDGSLNIWSLTDRERVVQFEVKSPALSQALLYCESKILHKISKYVKSSISKNPLVVVGYADGCLRIFDIDKKNIVNKIKAIGHEITVLNHCKNTSIILAGTSEGLIAIVDLNHCSTTRIINDHRGSSISSIDSFYKEDKKMTYWLAASKDRRVSVWTSRWNDDMFQMIEWLSFPTPIVGTQKESSEFKGSSSDCPPSLAQFAVPLGSKTTPDTIVYVGHGFQKQILFYNINTKQITRTMNLSEWPECFSISPNLKLIALGTKSRLLQIKDYNQSTFQDYSQHSDTVRSVCFSNDGKKLFSTAYNEIFVWDILV